MSNKHQTKFYSFSALDEKNRKIRGIIDAPNKSIAHYMLAIIGLKKISKLFITLSSHKKTFALSLKEKIQIFNHLSMLEKSGSSLIDSLSDLKSEVDSFKLKYALFFILKYLREGHKLSVSLQKLPYSSFSTIEINLIKTSEISGRLDIAFGFIVEKLQNKLFVRSKIISASIYPSITLMVSFIVIFIVFHWVIPQFSIIFSQSKHALPWITQFVFSCAKHIGEICFVSLSFIALIIFCMRQLIKYKKIPAEWHEKLLVNFPVMGKILILTNKINFCHSMFTLLNAGIPIHDAMAETIQQLNLPHSKKLLHQAMTKLIAGKSLSTSLKRAPFFSRSAIQTIHSAENTGNLDDAFQMLFQRYSHDLSSFSDHLEKAIEPFIIILLGSIIGCIVIAIYLPIFQLGGLY